MDQCRLARGQHHSALQPAVQAMPDPLPCSLAELQHLSHPRCKGLELFIRNIIATGHDELMVDQHLHGNACTQGYRSRRASTNRKTCVD